MPLRNIPWISLFFVHEVHDCDLSCWLSVDYFCDRIPKCTQQAHYGSVIDALAGIIRFGGDSMGPGVKLR